MLSYPFKNSMHDAIYPRISRSHFCVCDWKAALLLHASAPCSDHMHRPNNHWQCQLLLLDFTNIYADNAQCYKFRSVLPMRHRNNSSATLSEMHYEPAGTFTVVFFISLCCQACGLAHLLLPKVFSALLLQTQATKCKCI